MNRLLFCALFAAGIALSGCDDGDTIVRMSPAPDPDPMEMDPADPDPNMMDREEANANRRNPGEFAVFAGNLDGAVPTIETSAQIAMRASAFAAQTRGGGTRFSSSRLHAQDVNTDTLMDRDSVIYNSSCGTPITNQCVYTNASDTNETLGRITGRVQGTGNDHLVVDFADQSLPSFADRRPILSREYQTVEGAAEDITTFLVEESAPAMDSVAAVNEVSSYGAWLQHGGFAVIQQDIPVAGEAASAIYGLAGFYTPSGSRPEPLAGEATATYGGLMVGSPVAGDYRGNILQGDAYLDYAFATEQLNAEFVNIVDLDRGAQHVLPGNREDISFQNVPVRDNGTFGPLSASSNRFIRGSFAGAEASTAATAATDTMPAMPAVTGHDEVLGTFESDGIAGAFGAIRQQP